MALILDEALFKQLHPTDALPNALFTVQSNEVGITRTLIVANTSNTAKSYSIYAALDGSTFDDTTALFRNISIAKNDSHLIEFHLGMPEGTVIAVESSVGSTLTFTLSGGVVRIV